MWERYCRGVNAIVYMVDSADSQKIEVCYFKVCNLQFLDQSSDQSSEQASRTELKNLLERPQLAGIPVLVRGKTIIKLCFCSCTREISCYRSESEALN